MFEDGIEQNRATNAVLISLSEIEAKYLKCGIPHSNVMLGKEAAELFLEEGEVSPNSVTKEDAFEFLSPFFICVFRRGGACG